MHCIALLYSVWLSHGDYDIVAEHADIEADSVGGTPLHCAAKSGKAGIVKFLLANKAEPNSVSKYLCIPPLISAIYSKINTVECVELLLKANADPNKVSNGLSPLAHANHDRSEINTLIAAGADVDSVSSCGLRPIEQAALVNNVEAIQILTKSRIIAAPQWNLVNLRDEYIRKLKQNGDDAFDQQDYSSALASHTEIQVMKYFGQIGAYAWRVWVKQLLLYMMQSFVLH